MNKLLISDIIDLKEDKVIIESKNSNLTINVYKNSTVYLINQNLNKLVINMLDDSILNLYCYNNKVHNHLKVLIKQNHNSKIFYNASYVNLKDYELTIDNLITGNNNESHLSIRNISNKGLSKVVVNVFIDKDTSNNIALEDLKGINNGGFVHIEPNIECLSNEVIANHLTTIGSLNEEMLNYLMGKGITLEKAREILLQGFKFSNMDKYIKDEERR